MAKCKEHDSGSDSKIWGKADVWRGVVVLRKDSQAETPL